MFVEETKIATGHQEEVGLILRMNSGCLIVFLNHVFLAHVKRSLKRQIRRRVWLDALVGLARPEIHLAPR